MRNLYKVVSGDARDPEGFELAMDQKLRECESFGLTLASCSHTINGYSIMAMLKFSTEKPADEKCEDCAKYYKEGFSQGFAEGEAAAKPVAKKTKAK